jgi:hypothetical protein
MTKTAQLGGIQPLATTATATGANSMSVGGVTSNADLSADAMIVYVLCAPDRPHDLKLLAEYWGRLRSSIDNQSEHNLMSTRRSSGLHLDSSTLILQFVPTNVVYQQNVPSATATTIGAAAHRQLAFGVHNKVCRPLLKIERFLNPVCVFDLCFPIRLCDCSHRLLDWIG